MSYINDIGYNSAKHKSLMRNLAAELLVHGKLQVTQKLAKDLKKYVDPLITLGKRGDLHSLRRAMSQIRLIRGKKSDDKTALQTLFSDLAARYKDQEGGYTRIIKIENRRGDNAPMALIMLV